MLTSFRNASATPALIRPVVGASGMSGAWTCAHPYAHQKQGATGIARQDAVVTTDVDAPGGVRTWRPPA